MRVNAITTAGLFIFFAIVQMSCSTYQYNTISSESLSTDPSTGEFVSETDTVKVMYNFYGENAPVTIKIYNKLNSPIHVDWSRSALIVGEEAIGYSSNEIAVAGDILGNSTRYSRWSGNVDATIRASAALPEKSTFIPPHSQVEKNLPSVKQMLVKLPPDAFTKTTLSPIRMVSDISDLNIKIADFNRAESPLVFKSYLTFNLDSESKTFSNQHDFYISNVVRTSVSPKKYDDYILRSGNTFYSGKLTGYGKVMTGVGAATVLMVAGAVAETADKASEE